MRSKVWLVRPSGARNSYESSCKPGNAEHMFHLHDSNKQVNKWTCSHVAGKSTARIPFRIFNKGLLHASRTWPNPVGLDFKPYPPRHKARRGTWLGESPDRTSNANVKWSTWIGSNKLGSTTTTNNRGLALVIPQESTHSKVQWPTCNFASFAKATMSEALYILHGLGLMSRFSCWIHLNSQLSKDDANNLPPRHLK